MRGSLLPKEAAIEAPEGPAVARIEGAGGVAVHCKDDLPAYCKYPVSLGASEIEVTTHLHTVPGHQYSGMF